jgi:hypothetical protein
MYDKMDICEICDEVALVFMDKFINLTTCFLIKPKTSRGKNNTQELKDLPGNYVA